MFSNALIPIVVKKKGFFRKELTRNWKSDEIKKFYCKLSPRKSKKKHNNL